MCVDIQYNYIYLKFHFLSPNFLYVFILEQTFPHSHSLKTKDKSKYLEIDLFLQISLAVIVYIYIYIYVNDYNKYTKSTEII